MATLYEIESAIMDCVDAETGEIIGTAGAIINITIKN